LGYIRNCKTEEKKSSKTAKKQKICQSRKPDKKLSKTDTMVTSAIFRANYTKQLLDEVFVISRINEVDNPYRDLDYSGYHKN